MTSVAAKVDADATQPPIGDYAVIGDCRSAALVSRSGSVDWMCLPSFADGSVFAALLDRGGGYFAVRPADDFRTERRYRPQTPVLETIFETANGKARLTDLMPVEAEALPRLAPQRELLRIVEGLEGEVELDVRFVPRPAFAARPVRLRQRRNLGWSWQHHGEAIYLMSEIPLAPEDGASALVGRFRVRPGERRRLSMVFTRNDPAICAPLGAHADDREERTERWWRDWFAAFRYDGPHREMVERSALTVKLLNHAMSGSFVAAATTSLPEIVGGSLNWDYRYCWMRDAALTMSALYNLGFSAEGQRFYDWLLYTTRLTRPYLSVLYDVFGNSRIGERELGLEGYRGSSPVRVGNAAAGQLQLDVYGALIAAAVEHLDQGGEMDPGELRMLADFGEAACRCWRERDNGIWEERGERKHFTLGKVMCCVALELLIRLSEEGHVSIPRERYHRERDILRHVIDTRGYNPALGAYTQTLDGETPDASLLLLSRFGYLKADDPRMVGTERFISDRLGHGALLYRKPPQPDRDGRHEATFGICGFWRVEYLAQCGRLAEAEAYLDDLIALGNDVGLYAEQIAPDTGEPIGNYPQALTHIGLINACVAVAHARHPRPTEESHA